MKNFLIRYRWKIAGVVLGGVAGFAYYYFIGCNSGTCPIQSHWHTSSLYGALIGYVLTNGPQKEKSAQNQETEKNQKKER